MAKERPEDLALVFGTTEWTFEDLHDRMRSSARLVDESTPPNGRVAVIGGNHPTWVDLYFSVPGVGRLLVFLNHRLAPAELADQIRRSATDLVIGASDQLARLRDTGILVPMIEWTEWDELVAQRSERRSDADAGPGMDAGMDLKPGDPDDPAWLLFTSGTTGSAKGALLSHSSVLAAVRSSAAARPVESDDVYVFPFPLCHVAGYNVVHRLAHGRPVVLLEGFDPVGFVAAVETRGATSTSFAATMLSALLDHLGDDRSEIARLRSLRMIAYGAAPMPALLLRHADEVLGADFTQGYGMTELSGNAVFLGPREHRRGLDGEDSLLVAAGTPAPGVELRIVDGEGIEVPTGDIGEVVIRSAQVMCGYLDDPQATAEVLRDGWLFTGDLGRIDEDGLLTVVDRSKDIIITGGENVASREVEDVLLSMPEIAQVAVVGVPDPRWGENVCAVIVPADSAPITADMVVAHARRRLAGFKVPRHVVLVDVLPVNASGKVVKRELREWLRTDPDARGERM